MTVDHKARRQRIAEVTAEVIAREGLEAATIRRISAELGGPTKTITYYFSDKQELLRFTWEHMARLYYEKVSHGPVNIIDSLLAMTTADEKSILRWRVYVAFWDRATRDPEFAQGISLQSLVDPERWPAGRIRAALTEQVAMLLPSAALPL
jgi:AcrR family transcriptional regulator